MGVIDKNIIRSKKNRKVMSTTTYAQGKSAITNFELIKEFKLTDKSILNYIKMIYMLNNHKISLSAI